MGSLEWCSPWSQPYQKAGEILSFLRTTGPPSVMIMLVLLSLNILYLLPTRVWTFSQKTLIHSNIIIIIIIITVLVKWQLCDKKRCFDSENMAQCKNEKNVNTGHL